MKQAYTNSLYDPAKERAWHLSLWVAPNVSAWCVHDVNTGGCMALQAAPSDLMPAPTLLPKRPVTVSFTALPEIGALVPESALSPGSEMVHLKMIHGQVPTGLLRDEPIGSLGARCIYLHDERAEHRLLTSYPNARSLPLQGSMVHLALARCTKGPAIIVHRTEKRLDLAIAANGKLLLSNTFHAPGQDDLLYFTLFALEQCGLSTATVDCHLCGSHLSEPESALLSRYIQHCAPLRPASLRDIVPDAHLWAALLEEAACAS